MKNFRYQRCFWINRWLVIGACLAVVFVAVCINKPVVAAGPFGGNDNKRLSIYNGTLLLDSTAWTRLGNAGRDIEASGRIYLRPNRSDRGSYLEGLPDGIGQRLHLEGGVNGSSTIAATWLGSAGVNETRGAVTGYFNGAPANAIGAAVQGEVVNCGAGKTCYAGYFSGNWNGLGVLAESDDENGSTKATVVAENTAPNGLAARFDGTFQANKWRIAGNTRGACSWSDVAGAELICPDNRFLSGVRSTTQPDATITSLYCCEL